MLTNHLEDKVDFDGAIDVSQPSTQYIIGKWKPIVEMNLPMPKRKIIYSKKVKDYVAW